jgi:hypothetical protein
MIPSTLMHNAGRSAAWVAAALASLSLVLVAQVSAQ